MTDRFTSEPVETELGVREMRNKSCGSQNDMANEGSTATRLAAIFSGVLRVPHDRIHPELGPLDVPRWDSVGHVSLILAIEEEFSIHFAVEEIMEFTSFQTILTAVDRAMALPSGVGGEERVGM
jgi:acyl carrier protein